MISVEAVRDLIYREENETLLDLYRSGYAVKYSGLSVDETLFTMVQVHLKERMPLWLAEIHSIISGHPLLNYETCAEFAKLDPTALRTLELICKNLGKEVSRLDYGGGSFSVMVKSPLNLPEKYTHMKVQVTHDHLSFVCHEIGHGLLYHGLGCYTLKQGSLTKSFSNLIVTDIEKPEMIECINYMVGIPDYINPEGMLAQ